MFDSSITLARDVEIDGSGLITLAGQVAPRLFVVNGDGAAGNGGAIQSSDSLVLDW